MTELRSLFYADWCAFVNDVRRGLRSPGRSIVWVLYALSLILFVISRAYGARSRGGIGSFGDRDRADFLICAQVVGVALALAFGAGRIGVFRSLAEARFIVGSVVPAPIAIAYLQARESATFALRALSSLFYIGFFAAPRHLGPLSAIADVVIVAGLLAATSAIALTRRLASPPWPAICRVLGTLLAILVLAPVVRDLAHSIPIPFAVAARIREVIPAIHPGLILLVPSPIWLAAPLGIVAVAVAVLALGGRDRYPELYALSLSRIDGATLRAERRNRKRAAAASRPTIAVNLPAPAGSLVLVWKSVVAFRRNVNQRNVLIGAAFWLVVGYALARASASTASAPLFIGTLSSLAVFTLFVLSVLATGALGYELRRPLFWLCDISLFERLAALVLAKNWRKLVTSGLLTIGLAFGGGSPLELYACGILLPAIIVLVGTIGFAVYALVPTGVAGGGPVALVRLAVSFALLVPIIGTTAVAAILGVPVAAALVTLLLISESVALIGLSAWRIDGRIDRLVT